jgi:hypothetical protein
MQKIYATVIKFKLNTNLSFYHQKKLDCRGTFYQSYVIFFEISQKCLPIRKIREVQKYSLQFNFF